MSKLLIILLISVSSVACTAQKDAQLRADRAHDALIAEHKMLNADSDVAREQASINYYSSDKAKAVRAANESLKKLRGNL